MERHVTYCTPENCPDYQRNGSEYSRIFSLDNYPCCKCCGKKCCELRYGKLDKLVESGRKRRKRRQKAKLQDPNKALLGSQNQKYFVIKRKERQHKKMPKKAKYKHRSSSRNTCVAEWAASPRITTTACPAVAACTKPTKRGSRWGRLLGWSHPPRTWSPQDETPFDTDDANEMTNDFTYCFPENYESCVSENPKLQYDALFKCFNVLHMKEKQLKSEEKNIKKKDRILQKKIRKFQKQGDAREKANLRAAKMMEVARCKLFAYQNRKDKIVKHLTQKHYEAPKYFQACGDRITVKMAQCKDKCILKPRWMPSIPCLFKACGKGAQPPNCRGAYVKRLLGLSKPCPVRKPARLAFPYNCMVKADEMMQSRKMRDWTTVGDACQQILRSPPLPWVHQPSLYPRRRYDSKVLWKRLGYLLLCVAGILYWVPFLICLQCLCCCCCSE